MTMTINTTTTTELFDRLVRILSLQITFWSPGGNLVYYHSAEDTYQCLYARHLDPLTKQPQGEASWDSRMAMKRPR